MADEMSGIVPLEALDDFEVADEDPDVRGWEVFSSDGKKIGEVDELLIDTATMKVRYLDVDLEDDLLDTGKDRHVLLPIGYARLNEDGDQVFVDALASTDIDTVPIYPRGLVVREYEERIVRHFDPDYSPAADRDFYAHDLYDESRFYGARRRSRRDDLLA